MILELLKWYGDRGLPNAPLTRKQQKALGRFLDNAEDVLSDAGLAPPVGGRGLPQGKP